MHIIEIRLFYALKELLLKADSNTLILLDIDDTIITPKANMFRYGNHPYHKMIDELKKNKAQIPNFIEILSHWRLKRQSILVHEAWPALMEQLKENTTVLGLTQMDTGSFGQIALMEEWRYQELKAKNILFSDTLKDEKILEKDKGYALLYKGMMMTGPFSKSQVLNAQLHREPFKNKSIIFVDDRADQVNDLGKLCKALNIPYQGIIYRGIEEMSGTVDPRIAELQKKHLLEKGQWLEDDEFE